MSKVSPVSSWTACPLDVTRAWLPSGEMATAQGPPRPGPSVTVTTLPAGVSAQPDGVVGALPEDAPDRPAATQAVSAAMAPVRASVRLIPFPAASLSVRAASLNLDRGRPSLSSVRGRCTRLHRRMPGFRGHDRLGRVLAALPRGRDARRQAPPERPGVAEHPQGLLPGHARAVLGRFRLVHGGRGRELDRARTRRRRREALPRQARGEGLDLPDARLEPRRRDALRLRRRLVPLPLGAPPRPSAGGARSAVDSRLRLVVR